MALLFQAGCGGGDDGGVIGEGPPDPNAGDGAIESEVPTGGWMHDGDGAGSEPGLPAGSVCEDDAECESGYCIWHAGGQECAATCIEQCPPGFHCVEVASVGSDPLWICASLHASLCLPCTTDSDCTEVVPDSPSTCLDYGPPGSFCATTCSMALPCPEGYVCTKEALCRLDAEECLCTDAATRLRLQTPCFEVNSSGICLGERYCDEAGLTQCSASEPSPELCDGIDNDCNGTTDAFACDDGDVCTEKDFCEMGKCGGAPVVCDDDDPCTDDVCVSASGCIHTENGACACAKDEDCPQPLDKCLGVRACVTTEAQPLPHCVIAAGSQVVCDPPAGPHAPCLETVCLPETGACAEKPASDGAPCDLGLTCTTDDLCQVGQCVPGKPVGCDDKNVCTVDTCTEESGCVHSFDDGLGCDDGDVCTEGDVCKAGLCKGKVKSCDDGDPCTKDACVPPQGCVSTPVDIGCDDSNPCTDDACVPGNGCKYVANTKPCDDGDACTGADSCAQGQCKGKVLDCDDADPCTKDACVPGEGCTSTPAGLSCDDANPCTDDFCKPGVGCAQVPNSLPCDDSDACTQADGCSGGKCAGTKVLCDDGDPCTKDLCIAGEGCKALPGGLVCNDGNPCTDDTCVQGAGCKFVSNAAPCDDGDACTTADKCAGGKCKGGPPPSCTDGNPCTKDLCDPAKGCASTPDDSLPCSDGDPCTVGDACKAGACVHAASFACNDQNPCTKDSCVATGCSFAPVPGAECDDSNACTTADACTAAGWCLGVVAGCDDKNPCTDDSCDPGVGCVHSPNTNPCSDGDACTFGDTCKDGECAYEAAVDCDDGNPCTIDDCAASGCVHAPDDGAPCNDGNACTTGDACKGGWCLGGSLGCDDGNPCTDDACQPGVGCVHTPNTKPCTDGDTCTVGDTCKGGKCVPSSVIACDDKNPCTKDGCAATGCVHTPLDGSPCDDKDACTKGDACKAGWCLGTVIACDDGNPCTDDGCSPTAGCTSAPNAKPCTDGNACTVGDACKAGACVPGAAAVCDDKNPCTKDACDAAKGCTTAPADGAQCDDGNACTVGDACKGGLCVGGSLPCDDGNICTNDGCQVGVGCVFTPNTAPCDDKDPCTLGDVCKSGKCQGGAAMKCDDSNPCTSDACKAGACVHAPADGKSCDDANACTQADTCSAGLCGGVPTPCDDSNPCTDDGCDKKTGCTHAPNTAPCTDGDPCTLGDVCKGSACVASGAVKCDDLNPCTKDACVGGACKFTPEDGKACDDKNACTGDGTCKDGTCKPGVIACNDQNPCTDDACDPAKGCVFSPNAAPCSDGNACTIGDQCANGGCLAGAPMDCADQDPCTQDSCAAGKCKHVPVTGNTCNDYNACTTGDVCNAGICLGKSVDCDDKNICTKDACDTAKGCTWTPLNGQICDDGNACTAPDACAGATCTGATVSCDDKNTCTTDTCQKATGCAHTLVPNCCGNGISEAGEVCDDGNQVGGDGCSADCKSKESCGNGILDPGEVCDGGAFPYECWSGYFLCSEDCDAIDTSKCTSFCGDGKWDPAHEECEGTSGFPAQCWDGAFACTPECKLDASSCKGWCGDGIANGPEQCDKGDVPGCPIVACSCAVDCTTAWVSVPKDEGWDTGTMDGAGSAPAVTPDPECKDPSTLCLDATKSKLAHVWIANSDDSEVVKINVDTGAVEKQVPSLGYAPSRTAVVVKDGSVWVGNRGEVGSTAKNNCNYGVGSWCSNVVHFAADGSLICRGDVPGIVRAVALDSDGNVWAGSYLERKMYKLSGTQVDSTKTPARCVVLGIVNTVGRPYGAVGDSKGNVFVANNDNWVPSFDPAGQSLQQIDAVKAELVGTFVPPPAINSPSCYQNYGIAIDAKGRILIGSEYCRGAFRFTPGSNTWEWRAIPEGTPRGIVSDFDGYTYAALSCKVLDCWADSADLVARISPDFKSHTVLSMGPGISHPVGASIDHNGRLWTTGRKSNTAARVEVAKWGASPKVDIFPTLGENPYTYSDMTGIQHLMFVNPKGTWTRYFDSGLAAPKWKVLDWKGKEVSGVTDIAARVRSAATVAGLASTAWSPYHTTRPVLLDFVKPQARYLEVEMRLTSNNSMMTPVLQSLTVHWTK